MGASSFTNRLGLPIYTGTDTVDPLNEVNAGNRAADTKAALAIDAPIPCTAAYDTATKRHTLTPTQTGITLPDIFTARFLSTTAFTAGDKVYIGGAEYVTSYTDGDTAVETGVWIANAVVSLDCKKAGLKAYVGAGFGKQLSKKAPAGYGLGEVGGKPLKDIDLDTIFLTGVYDIETGCTQTPPNTSNSWSKLVVIGGRACVQKYYPVNGGADGEFTSHLCRIYHSELKTWKPWEWVNPPLLVGVEYRTTARYMGKPVYAQVVNFGVMPNNSAKVVQYQPPGVVDKMVKLTGSCYGSGGSCFTLPIRNRTFYASAHADLSNITVNTDSDLSAYTAAHMTVYYTKI